LNYYNEKDPYAAAWLRNLVLEGLIAPGEVDERSIEDVTYNDIRKFTQCHFFAGIGCWSYALRLAGWPDDRPVWTGSCPCQPFSAAGKAGGFADERHLWPAWFHLIEICKPRVIFGEQVASKDGLAWLDLVQTDLEGAGYAIGANDLSAAGVGAPHIRQRLYFVADSADGIVDIADSVQSQLAARQRSRSGEAQSGRTRDQLAGSSPTGFLGDDDDARLEGRGDAGGGRGNKRTPWTPSDFVWCRDQKWRPVEPGTFPLAHGVANRVGRLRAYGNAIVAPLAAEFIEAYRDVTGV